MFFPRNDDTVPLLSLLSCPRCVPAVQVSLIYPAVANALPSSEATANAYTSMSMRRRCPLRKGQLEEAATPRHSPSPRRKSERAAPLLWVDLGKNPPRAPDDKGYAHSPESGGRGWLPYGPASSPPPRADLFFCLWHQPDTAALTQSLGTFGPRSCLVWWNKKCYFNRPA